MSTRPTRKTDTLPPVDFASLFDLSPNPYLILSPSLVVVAVNQAYLDITLTQREALLGRTMADIFPDNPEAPSTTAPDTVHASLARVVATRAKDIMPILRYDIPRPASEGGGFDERYWSPINAPVLDAQGNILYIIHHPEDVTPFVLRNRELTQQNAPRTLKADPLELETFMQIERVGAVNERLRSENEATLHLMASIIENSVDAIMSVAPDGTILSWNPSAEKLFGFSEQEAVGKHVNIVYPPELHEEERHIRQELSKGNRVVDFEARRMHKDGSALYIWTTISPIRDVAGNIIGSSRVIRDLRERRETERMREQLRQSQKMEAIGQLTGGIAHDFNNLLAVIIGNLDFMNERAGTNDPLRQHIAPAIAAAEHGAELTRQLLAFGRKQTLQPRTFPVNEMLEAFLPLVRHTLGAQLTIQANLAPVAWHVHIDQSLLQNALLNLSVNARDAMPDGGNLLFETANIVLDETYAAHHADVVPGEYVMIAVNDSGCGMPPEVAAKVFEPFFTTKEVGKGTGLGLSMVYGFIKQSNGHISIYSEVGHGTSIRLYLPRAGWDPTTAAPEPKTTNSLATPGKDHLILIVEDNPDVLKLTATMVMQLGYRALQATNGQEALDMLSAHPQIDLLLTDVMLPGGINGPALAKTAQELRPGIKVLFNSGYA